VKGSVKPKKIKCEICAESSKSVLHYHHIIPQTDPGCTDDWINVCIVCSNCHNKIHADEIKVIGIFPSTQLPYKRTLVYEKNGICNVPGIDKEYIKPQQKKMRLYEKKE
jgi:hypothetical protein